MMKSYTAPNGKVVQRKPLSDEARKKIAETCRATVLKNQRSLIAKMNARTVKPSYKKP
jgi:hypothetical protein